MFDRHNPYWQLLAFDDTASDTSTHSNLGSNSLLIWIIWMVHVQCIAHEDQIACTSIAEAGYGSQRDTHGCVRRKSKKEMALQAMAWSPSTEKCIPNSDLQPKHLALT